MKRKRRKKAAEPPKANVVITTRDASRDYWLPEAKAKQLYEAGKLCKIQVTASSLSYGILRCTPCLLRDCRMPPYCRCECHKWDEVQP